MDKTLSEAGKLIAASRSIVLTTHAMPDGDGLGAEIALYHYLERMGKTVRIVNPDPAPARFQFLDRRGTIEVVGGTMRRPWEPIDLAIVVDTNDPRRLGPVWSGLRAHAEDILFFDHHPDLMQEGAPELRDLRMHRVLDVKSSSVGELLYRLFMLANDLLDPTAASFRLSPEIAVGLYVSIMTDTNSFRYARTTALSHRIAADLIDYGLQPEEIYQNVYSSKSVEHLRLIGEVLSNVSEEQGVAWAEIPKELRQRHGASGDDTQNIVNFLMLLKNADVLVLLREEDDGVIKVSLKSKGVRVVNELAHAFGGGGHEFAAGFSKKGSMREIRKKLEGRLRDEKKEKKHG